MNLFTVWFSKFFFCLIFSLDPQLVQQMLVPPAVPPVRRWLPALLVPQPDKGKPQAAVHAAEADPQLLQAQEECGAFTLKIHQGLKLAQFQFW